MTTRARSALRWISPVFSLVRVRYIYIYIIFWVQNKETANSVPGVFRLPLSSFPSPPNSFIISSVSDFCLSQNAIQLLLHWLQRLAAGSRLA